MANLARISKSGAMQINSAIDRQNALTIFVKQSLQPGLDYGKIPGCGEKPVLFKPGAEKIAALFGLYVELERLECVKDYTGKNTDGEAFFAFEYRATLRNREGSIVAQCDGSCNSWEDKYRWRKAERTCPDCGEATILKSKQDGSWFCWTKRNGCGAKFRKGDPRVEGQEVGRKPNDRIFDQINTLSKMAQKRAFVGAVMLGAGASNYFAVDHTEVEGINVVDADWEPAKDISTAQALDRIEVIDDGDDGPSNQARIASVIGVTAHLWSEVSDLCTAHVRQIGATSELTDAECRQLICWMLADYGATKRHCRISVPHSITQELIKQQPNISDDLLIERFLIRLDELTQDAPVASRGPTETFRGVSI